MWWDHPSMEETQSYHKTTLAKINLSKESLGLIVILEDGTTPELTHELSKRFGAALPRAREGAVNPDAPACSPSFGTSKIRRILSSHELPACPPMFSLILPHDLLKGTRLKKR